MTPQQLKERIAKWRANPAGPMLALIPESRSAQRKLHFTDFKPTLGASKVDCELCEERCWIGPKQKAFKDAHPETPMVCLMCATRHGAQFGHIKSLGGHSHEYEMDGERIAPDNSKN